MTTSLERTRKTGVCKGDWRVLAKAGANTLWEVVTKEGATHEVVTTNFQGEELILEIDGKSDCED